MYVYTKLCYPYICLGKRDFYFFISNTSITQSKETCFSNLPVDTWKGGGEKMEGLSLEYFGFCFKLDSHVLGDNSLLPLHIS